ncbi:hypothetical protein AcW1_006109 [Taiwanofungus camphoratus]|nr:hypothetical protein AcW2_004871 [Antrodia cinnamomea]KAI0934660.1 hypothetical protein AcV5_006429 [Antrodia cinnamomea]KAI0950054.1 hypothetical protein AcV7_008638 [Antrodia cinnamomea]KAI0957854.1 hypothetical protein AcW1_006109 [Antrodia cinnamomea]
MSCDGESPTRQFPTLVQLCQRVASAHVDSICSLGDRLRFELVQPVLENCSADTLLRLEQASPFIEKDTTELWKKLCLRSYPLIAHQHQYSSIDEPESWRNEYFILRDMEAKRFEELGTRLRTQRQEAAERRKESQIKITDRVPPAKRARGFGAGQPKTLFQKTRSEAARVQKGIYGMHTIPPMPRHRTLSKVPSAKRLPPPSSGSTSSATSTSSTSSTASGSHVTVKSVTIHRRPTASVTKPASAKSRPPSRSPYPSRAQAASNSALKSASYTGTYSVPLQTLPLQSEHRAMPSRSSPSKKDPMTSLFMPKHRAHSQLPTPSVPSRT